MLRKYARSRDSRTRYKVKILKIIQWAISREYSIQFKDNIFWCRIVSIATLENIVLITIFIRHYKYNNP